MRARVIVLTSLALLTLPAAADAARCEDKKVAFTSTEPLKESEFTGGGGLGKKQVTLGEDVATKTLTPGTSYYVPKDGRANVTIDGYVYKVGPGTHFIPQCSLFGSEMFFRLLEGSVSQTGKRPAGNRAYGYVVTPDATILPRPGKADFSVDRVVTNKRSTTYSHVESDPGASLMFVKISSVAKRGKEVPCQGGRSVRVYASGAYKNGS